jgi:outer membrane lipoprotein-sorting protein
MDERFRIVMLGVAVCLIGSISIGTGATVGDPNPDRIVTKAVSSLENEPVEAVQVQEIDTKNGEITQTVAIHKEDSTHGYLEILGSSTDRATQQVVLDGSTVWRRGNDVTLRYRDVEWFEELQTVGADREVVADQFEGTYRGTTRLEGQKVHVIALQPPDKTTATLSLDIDAGDVNYQIPIHKASERTMYLSRETWWIDTETYYPIRQTVEWTDQNGNVIATATKEYEELILGPQPDSSADGSDSDALITSEEYTVPESNIELMEAVNPSAEESTTDTEDEETGSTDSVVLEPETHTTRDSVNESVPFDLPSLEVPPGYTFDRGSVHAYDGAHAAWLFYEANNTGETLSVQVSDQQSALFQGHQILYERDIDGIDGKLVVTESGTEAVYNCEETTVRISGLSERDALIELTESIECL